MAMKWKMKLKGTGTPPPVAVGSSSGSGSFNAPEGQSRGTANNRMSPHLHSGRVPGQPPNPDTSQFSPKRRAHFPSPRSSRNVGRTLKTGGK